MSKTKLIVYGLAALGIVGGFIQQTGVYMEAYNAFCKPTAVISLPAVTIEADAGP